MVALVGMGLALIVSGVILLTVRQRAMASARIRVRDRRRR
jgi:uncharacterized iron-regulated membrane protein